VKPCAIYFFENKNKNPRIYGLNKLLFWYLALQFLGSFSHMAKSRSSSKFIRKTNLIPKVLWVFLIKTASKQPPFNP
jgi:hypothetical protein